MGNRKCCKCFRHEKKTVPYQGHVCPYRDCNCEGCQPKRKSDPSNAKRGRPRLTSAPSYQLPMMSGIQHVEQARIFASGGIPCVTMPSPTSISSSSMHFDSVAARQAPPVVKTQPATSQAFILINNSENTSELPNYVKKGRIRNIPPNMINALYQKRMLSSGPKPSSLSFLSANTSEAYSRHQIPIQHSTNIDSKGIRQAIHIPFTAPRLLNSAYFTHASSSTMTGSISQSNTVPRGYRSMPLFSSIECVNDSKSKIRSVSISSTPNSIITNPSRAPSPQGQNRFSYSINYNHPILKTANQKGTVKSPVLAHQATSNIVHFAQQSNPKIDTMKQSSLSFQPVASTFSHNSPLSECSRNWSQSPLATNSTSAAPGNPFLNTTRLAQFNPAPKSDDRSEHVSTNQSEIPSCSPPVSSTSIYIKPDSLSYNPIRNYLKQRLTAVDNLKGNSKFPLQVQQVNSIINTADYKKVSECKISSVRPFSSTEQPSESSMASPKLKIPGNTLSSLNNNNSLKNVGLSCHSNSNLKTHESSESICKDGLRIEKNSTEDISVPIPSSTESFEHIPVEPSIMSSRMSDQMNTFVDLETCGVLEKLVDNLFKEDKDNIKAGNCQEPNQPYGERNEFIAKVLSSLDTKAYNEKKFALLKDAIHVLKLMFPEIPLKFLLPVYIACDSAFFPAVQELCFIVKKKRISPDLMARCQQYSKRFVDQRSTQEL